MDNGEQQVVNVAVAVVLVLVELMSQMKIELVLVEEDDFV